MTVAHAFVERFKHRGPAMLMVRLALQRALDTPWVEDMFAQHT